jgi:predicted DNA-binding transcriptional regulator AlpA
MRILRYADLRPKKGITYSREHIRRLEAEGKWPRRLRLAEGAAYFGWLESEIDAHLAARAEARDEEAV